MDTEVLRARLLGPMDLRVGERQLAPLDSVRAESLLAYLLLHHDAPQPRQRLAFLLWPDSTERQAHTNLRNGLHKRRRSLPETDRLIDIGPRTLQWRADASLWLDVEHFERAVAEGRLEEAVETYAGELLEGCYDEWLVDERERLAALHLEALERLARRLSRVGAGPKRFAAPSGWSRTIRCARRVTGSGCSCATRPATVRVPCAHTMRARRRWSASSGSSPRGRPARCMSRSSPLHLPAPSRRRPRQHHRRPA
jgi:hypothetical protein